MVRGKSEPSFASFGHLIEDAKVLTESIVNFTVSHVKRQGDFVVPSHFNA